MSAPEDREPAHPAENPPPETESLRMTPLLWVLGVVAILVGIVCGVVMSAASLTK